LGLGVRCTYAPGSAVLEPGRAAHAFDSAAGRAYRRRVEPHENLAERRSPWWVQLGFLVLIVVAGTGLRVHGALSDPAFRSSEIEGLLRSDPALLYYLTQRVTAAGGAPADWRADANLAYPETVDVPSVYTVGQEFLVAAVHGLGGSSLPLHLLCIWLFALTASLTGAFVYGCVRELTAAPAWARLAALSYLVLPANYRTLGFVLVREDLSLPLFAAHVWLALRAVRTRSLGASLMSALLALAALATWHAMTFVLALEGLALLLWFIRTRANVLAGRAGFVAWIVLVLGALSIPVLRAKGFVFSFPVAVGFGLICAARRPAAGRPIALAATVAWTALGSFSAAASDFRHVFEVLAAKVQHFGQLPRDPLALSFDARLLWQGPFQTLSAAAAWDKFGPALLFALPLVVFSLSAWRRARDSHALGLLSWLLALFAGAGWLVVRVTNLFGFLLPVVGVAWIATRGGPFVQEPRFARARGAAFLVAALLLGQHFFSWYRRYEIPWYRPAVRQAELSALIDALPEQLPSGTPIATDFLNAPALLAHGGYSMVLQPKWETRASRARVERFWQAFYHGTTDDLRRFVMQELQCRHLLVDRYTLGVLRVSTYVAGLPSAALKPGTAAQVLLRPDTAPEPPGYRLLWRSSDEHRLPNGAPSDFYRLYELAPDTQPR